MSLLIQFFNCYYTDGVVGESAHQQQLASCAAVAVRPTATIDVATCSECVQFARPVYVQSP